MQPVRYAEVLQLIVCLLLVCVQKRVKANRDSWKQKGASALQLSGLEGWNQRAAIIYILNQWQFLAGKYRSGGVAKVLPQCILRSVHQTLLAAEMVQFTF